MGCTSSRKIKISESFIPIDQYYSDLKANDRETLQVCLDDYTTIQLLGIGKSCEVLLSLFHPQSSYRALKIIKKVQGSSYFIQEAQLVRSLSHPNIITIYDLLEDDHNYYISSFYCEGGDLCKFLKTRKTLLECEVAFIMRQVFQALSYCHDRKIIHRDLKLENILLVKPESFDIKIADFGLAFKADKNKPSDACGTLPYMAPEINLGSYDEKVDLWSAGVVMFLLAFGKFPFGRMRESLDLSKEVVGEGSSQEFSEVVKGLLQVLPENRPSAKKVLDSQWLGKFK
jgi:calcium-dependent protein kinase